MARPTRSARLLRNARAALLAAIEIYNKPDFRYREETFAILAVNAWELLLKAKVLERNKSDPRSLYVSEKVVLKDGTKSLRKQRIKRNRSGNPLTVSLEGCYALLAQHRVSVPDEVRTNIEALTAIRDNAIHYMNASPRLAKLVLEYGTACLRNFIDLGKIWLGLDLSEHSLLLLPIGFLPTEEAASAHSPSPDEAALLEYLASLPPRGSASEYHVSLDVLISYKKSPAVPGVPAFQVTTDPSAPKVQIAEEDRRVQWPWDYDALTLKLRKRYVDFKANQKYHDTRNQILQQQPHLRDRKLLDVTKPESTRKDYYSPHLVAEFDKHYTRKKA